MKVGLILECTADGPDKTVCEYLVRMLDPTIEPSSVTLTNKRILIQESGKVAAQLLADGCKRVVIVWDLHPPWRDTKPCRREDRESILQSLTNAGVNPTNVFLVCIKEELEAWLLADERALITVLSRPAHLASFCLETPIRG